MKHFNDIRATARFEEPERKHRYRLDLTSEQSEGEVVCAVMQNPSYADEQYSDRSVKYLADRAFRGSDDIFPRARKLIVVNLFSDVQTNGFSPKDRPIDEKNAEHIRDALREANSVIIAWGRSNRYRRRQLAVLLMIGSMNKHKVYYQPTHPSRAPNLERVELLSQLPSSTKE